MISMMSQDSFLKKTEEIKVKIRNKLSNIKSLQINKKSDHSIVTEVDIYISNVVENAFAKAIDNFYCEEKDYELVYPTTILDPIDGTREFSQGIPECVVSLSVFRTEKIEDAQYSWIYNPLNQDEFFSFTDSFKTQFKKSSQPLVSHTEFEKGLFNELEVKPVGSIAYKLALLSVDKAPYVISLRPKNIWDIAAGTHLCHLQGYSFYENGVKVSVLDKKLYKPPLVWIKEDFYEGLILEMKKNNIF